MIYQYKTILGLEQCKNRLLNDLKRMGQNMPIPWTVLVLLVKRLDDSYPHES